jgi:hypothetical protein
VDAGWEENINLLSLLPIDVLVSADQEEMFRATGQASSSRPISAGPHKSSSNYDHQDQSAEDRLPNSLPKSPHAGRTFSEDVEEEKTAGSGTDVLAELGVVESTSLGDGAQPGSDGGEAESRDLSQEEDEHVPCTQVLEGGGGVGEEVGVANGKVGVANTEEGRKVLSDMEMAAKANPAYEKYLMEKRQMSEELKQRSELNSCMR